MIGYDGLAKWYDRLQYFVFGDTLLKLQQELVMQVSKGDRVLFIGGGTGAALPALMQQKPVSVDYVEKSEKMLRIAREKTDQVVYIQKDYLEYKGSDYDVIVTFFVLDVFSLNDLQHVCNRIYSMLKPGGLLLYADFKAPQSARHKFLLWLMIGFFRVSTRLGSTQLLDHSMVLKALGFSTIRTTDRLDGFLRGEVFRK